MNRYSTSLIILITILFSCKDYSDLKLVVRNETIDIIDPKIQIALVGSESINGVLKIKVDDHVISQGSIESHFDSEFQNFILDFSKEENVINLLSKDIQENKYLEFEILFINEDEKIKIADKHKIALDFPPMSTVMKADGKNYVGDSKKSSVLLQHVVKNKNRKVDLANSQSLTTVLKPSDVIRIKLLVDTVYKKSFIWRYPAPTNNYYSEVNIESNLKEEIEKADESIKTEFTGVKEDGYFVITDEYKVEDGQGEIALYLINLDELNNYFIQQVGSYLADGTPPQFKNSSYCSFNGNPLIEGQVCLDTKHFYGYNPYKVPFVGRAYGDVAKIYIDREKVPFQLGEEIYFKKSVYLDGGYNRISIKIVDGNGNVTESFIPVTIENLDDTKIDIDNEINIEN